VPGFVPALCSCESRDFPVVTAGNLGYRKALIALSYRNSKLEKEREKEEVCEHYLSTLAWSRLY
jgi:hypothetical protein